MSRILQRVNLNPLVRGDFPAPASRASYRAIFASVMSGEESATIFTIAAWQSCPDHAPDLQKRHSQARAFF
jgi:hypothetical protein